jgi:hypothetical protein
MLGASDKKVQPVEANGWRVHVQRAGVCRRVPHSVLAVLQAHASSSSGYY